MVSSISVAEVTAVSGFEMKITPTTSRARLPGGASSSGVIIAGNERLPDGRDVINVGALGRPANDGDPRVRYAWLEARAGGRFLERTASGEEVKLGEVLACDPPNWIRYSWYPGSLGIPTQVEVRFTAEGGLTRVDVVHAEADSGLGEAWADRAVLFERGWGLILPAFAAYAERPGNPGTPHAARAAPAPGKGSTT